MHLTSVNLGQEQPIPGGEIKGKPSGTTGIFKTPAEFPVLINELGLQGDKVVDTNNLGGVDQAVYLYTQPDYDWWAWQLGRELAPGTFGENLTLSELESAQVSVGDLFTIGKVCLEVTAPRIPCRVLAARMNERTFVKRFRAAERPGIYCRVIQTGPVCQGDEVEYLPEEGDRITLLEMFRDVFKAQWTENELRRYLAAPIAIRDRIEKEQLLETLLANQT